MMKAPGEKTPPAAPDQAAPSAASSLFAIAKVLRPRGLRGEAKAVVLCDGPEHLTECLNAGGVFFWKDTPGAPAPRPIEIESLRFHAGHALISFPGVQTREAVETFRGGFLGMPVEALPATEENAWYHHQLEGLRVETVAGELLGYVERVEDNPAHDLLVVAPPPPETRRFRLPLIDAFVLKVDIEAGRIEADPPPGLIESQH